MGRVAEIPPHDGERAARHVGVFKTKSYRGPGGDVVVKGPHETNGAGVDAAVRRDRARSQDPSDLSRNRDLTVVPNAPASPSGPPPAAK